MQTVDGALRPHSRVDVSVRAQSVVEPRDRIPSPLEILREQVLIWESPFGNLWVCSKEVLDTGE